MALIKYLSRLAHDDQDWININLSMVVPVLILPCDFNTRLAERPLVLLDCPSTLAGHPIVRVQETPRDASDEKDYFVASLGRLSNLSEVPDKRCHATRRWRKRWTC
jgi:hypothetical protein